MKMKTMLTRITLAVTVLTAGTAGFTAIQPSASAATAVLMQGMSSSNVTKLQLNLKKLGYFSYPTATGYFGPVTLDAVKRFQSAYSLTVDGIAGPITQSAIAHALVKHNLVADTYNYIGIPYQWGGSTPSGFDCSGFVYYMFKKFGVPAQRSASSDLYNSGYAVSRSYLQPGDLVFFDIGMDGVVSHVGFYVGGGKFISATNSAGIFIQSLDNSYWGPRYMGAKRVY